MMYSLGKCQDDPLSALVEFKDATEAPAKLVEIVSA